jgi:septal ring factor EnvC (AmiA/AmiB activator)
MTTCLPTPLSRFAFAIAACVSLVSCGDDPALVEKREQQRTEIARLRGEVTLIEEKLKNLPPDRSAELAEAQRQAAEQKAELARLEKEIAELEERKRATEAEFQEYRRKYVIR